MPTAAPAVGNSVY